MADWTLLTSKATAAKIAASPSTLKRLVASGAFPQPVTISANRRGWVAHEIDRWIEAKAAARSAKPTDAPAS